MNLVVDLKTEYSQLLVACQELRDEIRRVAYRTDDSDQEERMCITGMSEVLHVAELMDKLRDLEDRQASAWLAYKRAEGKFVEQ